MTDIEKIQQERKERTNKYLDKLTKYVDWGVFATFVSFILFLFSVFGSSSILHDKNIMTVFGIDSNMASSIFAAFIGFAFLSHLLVVCLAQAAKYTQGTSMESSLTNFYMDELLKQNDSLYEQNEQLKQQNEKMLKLIEKIADKPQFVPMYQQQPMQEFAPRRARRQFTPENEESGD